MSFLVWEGADARTPGNFYRALVQELLLFISEMLVMSTHVGRYMGGFHLRVILQMTGRHPIQQVYGSWVYPPLSTAMVKAVLEEVDMYVSRRENTVAQFVVT